MLTPVYSLRVESDGAHGGAVRDAVRGMETGKVGSNVHDLHPAKVENVFVVVVKAEGEGKGAKVLVRHFHLKLHNFGRLQEELVVGTD